MRPKHLFLIAALLASALSVTPCLLAPDLVVPRAEPLLLEDPEIRVFIALVLPVDTFASSLGLSSGYHALLSPPCFPGQLPRFGVMAAEHIALAFPLWFVLLAVPIAGARIAITRFHQSHLRETDK